MSFLAKVFRKREWGKIEFPGDEKPEEYYDALSKSEAETIRKSFPSRTGWESYIFRRGVEEKSSLDVREEILHLDNMRLFDEMLVLESPDKEAATVVGVKDDQWYKVATFGDEAYLKNAEKAAAVAKPERVPFWFGVLALVCLIAVCVWVGLKADLSTAVKNPETIAVSSMPGVDFHQVTPEPSAPAQQPTAAEPEYSVYNQLTDETVTLAQRFPNLERVELCERKMKSGRTFDWLRCRLKNGDIYEAPVHARIFYDQQNRHVNQYKVYDNWIKVEKEFH